MPEPIRRVTLRLPESLYEWLRTQAYQERTTIQAITVQAIKDAHTAATGDTARVGE